MEAKANIKVNHTHNKLVEKAFNSYQMELISRSQYVKLIDAIMFKEDLKNGLVKI